MAHGIRSAGADPERAALTALLFFCFHSILAGYSVLSHEALIDTVWDPVIRPLLLHEFAAPSEAQLLEAHAYAYGGCVIQDMGYYPFGNRFFSDLTHYVRTGDFIEALFEHSHDMYEYSFALGALAHYAADSNGHPLAVNRSVPEIYPRLKQRYGAVVTFAEDPKAHILVEFSFDVVQIAGAGYLPQSYHNFIGFKVAKALLERAFQATYGIALEDLMNEDLAIGTYRRGASEVIPRMTQIAWNKKKNEIGKLHPGIARREFVYRLSRSNYERQWGSNYNRSRFSLGKWGDEDKQLGLFARFLIFLFELLPKVGPLQTLRFQPPNPQAQAMFIDSFRVTLDRYQALLADIKHRRLVLENRNLDTGKPIRAGDYELADRTYGKLLHRLAQDRFARAAPALRNAILAFYEGPGTPQSAHKNPEASQKLSRELEEMKAVPQQ